MSYLFANDKIEKLDLFNIRIQHFHLYLEYAQLFAALIARTAKDVDVLIDSLPSEESTAALQVSLITEPFIHSRYRFSIKKGMNAHKSPVTTSGVQSAGGAR